MIHKEREAKTFFGNLFNFLSFTIRFAKRKTQIYIKNCVLIRASREKDEKLLAVMKNRRNSLLNEM